MGDLVHVSSYLHLGINQVRITIQLVDVSFACDVEICEFPEKNFLHTMCLILINYNYYRILLLV